MTDQYMPEGKKDEQDLRAEIVRLNKIIQALMNRAERNTSGQDSDFNLFQTTIVLEEKVRRRTEELEASLRDNEHITRALRESEERFRGLVSQSLVGIGIIEDGKFSYVNSKLADIFGYNIDEISQLSLFNIIAKGDHPILSERIRKILADDRKRKGTFIYRGLRKDGVEISVEATGIRMSISGKNALIFTLMDITERVRAEKEVQELNIRLREQSLRDPLTGLFNRRYLEESLGRELIRAQRQNTSLSLIMGDIDHFKKVNDTYGHPAGDKVLKVFGELIRQYSRGSDICCRYGGEEFLLVCSNMVNEKAYERAEQLRMALLDTPVTFEGAIIKVTASFGVASYPQHGDTDDALISAADNALYEAKNAGRNQVKCYFKTLRV
jgi:diguanylate cyclase (GGDEF)-like protein/PAS domain S-box-containing protein